MVALGDSFIEVYGLNHFDRLASRLEKSINRNVFNLGAFLNIGPLKYYLIYKNIAYSLPRDTVLLGFLPSNYFIDNDSSLMNTSFFGKER